MRRADVPVVARIERAAFGREAWPAGAFALVSRVFTGARPPRGRFWVAESTAGRVVGYAGLEVSVLGGEADLVNVAVDPGHHRRGVGRALVGTAVRYCRTRRVAWLWLRVRASNRGARAFYRRCGFETAGRFRNYYEDPREDAVLMALTRPSRRRSP
jgi:[ribosomal protein S18]-alanine N-acetyltransferase